MTKDEYENLKTRAKATYDAATKDARERYEQDIKAIERVWQLSGEVGEPHTFAHSVLANSGKRANPSQVGEEKRADQGLEGRRPRGTVDETVQSLIEHNVNGDSFGSGVILQLARREYDPTIARSTVLGSINRLVDKGILRCVREGRGRNGSEYMKVQ